MSIGTPEPEMADEPMPFILDTDIGGEPDDALALAVAALMPALRLVVTSDEQDGRRARLARYLLDLLGRFDVPVVAGRDLGNRDDWAADGLVPHYVPEQSGDVTSAVVRVFEQNSGQVGWVGTGPLSNLADALATVPGVASRLVVTLSAGSHLIFTDRAEHNIGLDPAAARSVLVAALPPPWLVPVEVTMHPRNELVPDSLEYRILAASYDPARLLLRKHVDLWFDNVRPSVDLHAPLTLSYAVGMPFVAATPNMIGLDDVGRIAPGDTPAFVAESADYRRFGTWFAARLDRLESAIARHPAQLGTPTLDAAENLTVPYGLERDRPHRMEEAAPHE